MFGALKLRIRQGDPIIHDLAGASVAPLFQGMPVLGLQPCPDECNRCVEICPTQAIQKNPLSIDLGRCVFCHVCVDACAHRTLCFTNNCHLATDNREKLHIGRTLAAITPQKASRQIRSYFGKSLKLRQVSAGGCNGCELELNALNNVNFNMGRYGIDFVASPRHADGIVITGPITKAMMSALEICYEAVPFPKIVILVGTCAISGGIFQDSSETDRTFLKNHRVDLFIPGCPPHPLTFINGLLDWLDRR